MSRSTRWLLGLALSACHASGVPPVTPVTRSPTPEIEARIERITRDLHEAQAATASTLAERMQRTETPGVSIALVDDFQIEWARGFGVRAWDGDEPVDEHTVFQAASISKAIFALAVLRMVEAGHLELDTDVNARLQSWKLPAEGAWQPHVTLRQLLTHSGALTVHGFLGYPYGDPLPSLPQILNGEPPANNPRVHVLGLPGLAPRYSGGGVTVAQLLVTDVLQQPFASIMHDWLLTPLGMQHSTYAQPLPEDGRFEPALAHELGREVVSGKYRIHPEAAAAGLWTTPSDLALAMLAVMHAASGKEDGALPARWIAEMLTPQTAAHMGLGFFLSGEGDAKRFGHSGANVGYRADFVGYERLGKGAVVMINSGASELIDELMRAIAREYAWPAFASTSAAPPPAQLPQRVLRKLAGNYQTTSGVLLTLRVQADTLELEAGGQPPLPLTPRSATEFVNPSLELVVRFQVNAAGRAESLSVEQPDTPPTSARPVAPGRRN